MSWTIQQPPNPIVVNDAGNQVPSTTVVWVDKNNTTITAGTPIAEAIAESSWVSPTGVTFTSDTQVQPMTAANWNNPLITLTWNGDNYNADVYSSIQYDSIGVVFETSWG